MSMRVFYFYVCCTAILINIILFGYGSYHQDFGVQGLSLISFILLSVIFLQRWKYLQTVNNF